MIRPLSATCLRSTSARALQMECNMGYRPVCLFYDGEFRGLYLLTEKVEVNEGRVDVTDLEKANEMANPRRRGSDEARSRRPARPPTARPIFIVTA